MGCREGATRTASARRHHEGTSHSHPRPHRRCTVIAAALLASSAMAQSRGNARLSGKVVDDQGQPDRRRRSSQAQMTGQTDILSGKTDKKGEWRINGARQRRVEGRAVEGGSRDRRRRCIEVKADKAPPLNVTLEEGRRRKGRSDGGGQRGAADAPPSSRSAASSRRRARSTKICSRSIRRSTSSKGSSRGPTRPKTTFPQALAAPEGQSREGTRPNVELKLFQADLLMESGDKAGAKAILDGIDMTEVKDPYTYINQAINLINDKKGPEAVDLSDQADRAVPDRPTSCTTIAAAPTWPPTSSTRRGPISRSSSRSRRTRRKRPTRRRSSNRSRSSHGREASRRGRDAGAAGIRVRIQQRLLDQSAPDHVDQSLRRPPRDEAIDQPSSCPPEEQCRGAARSRPTSSTAVRAGGSSTPCGPIASTPSATNAHAGRTPNVCPGEATPTSATSPSSRTRGI